jgi:hypothetical protein
MKYSTYVALTATVAAQPNAKNPNYIISGDAAEAFQKDILQAGRDTKKFIKEDFGGNAKQWWNEQEANEIELQKALNEFNRDSENTFKDFVDRGDAANYDQKLDNIGKQLDNALWDLEKNANSNGYYARKNTRASPVKLWSAGMTASKTKNLNAKLMKYAKDAMKFGNDPVYGPFIMKNQ